MGCRPIKYLSSATGPKNRRTAKAASMTTRLLAVVAGFLATSLTVSLAAEAATVASEKTRVLVVTGGHGFEKDAFFKLFKDNPDIAYEAVEHPTAYSSLTPEAASKW